MIMKVENNFTCRLQIIERNIKMDENNLSFSMSQSITEECSELVSSIAEVTLDSVLEDGL